MSSAISSVGQGMFQFLQGITPTQQASSANGSTATSSPTQSVGGAGGHHHHGGHGQMFKQIQDAVTSALQSAQQSGGSTDPNQTIEQAIQKVLQNANGSTSSADGNQTAGTSTSTTDASGGTDSAQGSQQAFAQMLKSMGVDPQQFHQDFLAAMQDAQNGNVNPQTAMQSFPPGSNVDVTA